MALVDNQPGDILLTTIRLEAIRGLECVSAIVSALVLSCIGKADRLLRPNCKLRQHRPTTWLCGMRQDTGMMNSFMPPALG